MTKGGGGVRQMPTLADKGGWGVWLMLKSMKKFLEMAENMDIFPTLQDILIIFVKYCTFFQIPNTKLFKLENYNKNKIKHLIFYYIS